MDKLKKLQKENTLLEGRIDNSNNQTYTDMIVYLRGASISPYHQELIRNDIVNMLLEAQERQASLVSVFGEDRHDFINQVIKSTPKISKKEETLQRWDLAILLLTIQMIKIILPLQLSVIFAQRRSARDIRGTDCPEPDGILPGSLHQRKIERQQDPERKRQIDREISAYR